MGKFGKTVAAGLAAAAAGMYFLYSRSAGNRRKVRGWMLKLKGEVLEKMEALKDINEDTYKGLVEKAAARYRRLRTVNQAELEGLVQDLKSAWKGFQGKMDSMSKERKNKGSEGNGKGD
jgi:hypothetical protein